MIRDPGWGPFKPPPGRRRELVAPLAAACRIYIVDNHDMMPKMPSLGDPSPYREWFIMFIYISPTQHDKWKEKQFMLSCCPLQWWQEE